MVKKVKLRLMNYMTDLRVELNNIIGIIADFCTHFVDYREGAACAFWLCIVFLIIGDHLVTNMQVSKLYRVKILILTLA